MELRVAAQITLVVDEGKNALVDQRLRASLDRGAHRRIAGEAERAGDRAPTSALSKWHNSVPEERGINVSQP